MTRFEGYDALRREMAANDAARGAVQDAAADFFERPKDEQGSVLSTARRHTRFLSYRLLQDILTGDDLDLAELKTATDAAAVGRAVEGICIAILFKKTNIQI